MPSFILSRASGLCKSNMAPPDKNIEWDRAGDIEVAYVRQSAKWLRCNNAPDGYVDHDDLDNEEVPAAVREFAGQLGLRCFGKIGCMFIAGSNKQARLRAAWAAAHMLNTQAGVAGGSSSACRSSASVSRDTQAGRLSDAVKVSVCLSNSQLHRNGKRRMRWMRMTCSLVQCCTRPLRSQWILACRV